jgi:hypothetical protein
MAEGRGRRDHARAIEFCAGHQVSPGGGLFRKIVGLLAEVRRLGEENQELREEIATQREHAALTVVRAGDFLRAALSIIETGDDQYRSPVDDAAAGNSA